jgi:hypothetical protein
MRVRDNLGATSTASATVVVDAPPTAAFASAPAVVTAGNSATFVSTARDPDGSIARLEWDLDGDGAYDDGSAGTVTHTYPTTGVVTVHLRVTDDRGVTDVATGTVTVVANQAPLASFVYTPAAPIVGLPVLFSSRSSDPDGSIAAIAWDLDGDGAYDDASGGAASWKYGVAQNVMVSLRATDDRGASSIGFQTLSIRGSFVTPDAPTGPLPGLAPSSRPPSSPLSPGAPLITPFPIVRIRGQIAGGLVSISLLSVQAPRGAKVVIRCRGRGCPRARIIAHTASPSRAMRVRAFEATYRPGAQLQVFVSMPGRIGKYVSFVMRRSAAPTRRDLCVGPHRTTSPVRCPTR